MLSRCSTTKTRHQPRIWASVDHTREQWQEYRPQCPFDEFWVKQWSGLLGSSIFVYLGKLLLCFPVTDTRLQAYFLCSIQFIASLVGRQVSQVLRQWDCTLRKWRDAHKQQALCWGWRVMSKRPSEYHSERRSQTKFTAQTERVLELGSGSM